MTLLHDIPQISISSLPTEMTVIDQTMSNSPFISTETLREFELSDEDLSTIVDEAIDDTIEPEKKTTKKRNRKTTSKVDKDKSNTAQKIKEGWKEMFLVILLTANVAVNAIYN